MSKSQSLGVDHLGRILRDKSVERLFFKILAPNDNSKNQIYLGGDLNVINVIPSGDLREGRSSSRKPGESGRQILKAPIRMKWLDVGGTVHEAPRAQLILYPQYPEARLSGFLAGSSVDLSKWFDPKKRGRSAGRTLLIGLTPSGELFCHLAPPGSEVSKWVATLKAIDQFGALTEVEFIAADGTKDLWKHLRRIHELEWIVSKRLDKYGNTCSCNSPNCGGYTLEAELGIIPNGLAEPDFHGWEVKTFSVKSFRRLGSQVITLMTPEPDGGIYCEKGVEVFIKRFGYPDVSGRTDRLNFGGIHILGSLHSRTKLRLTLLGYDAAKGRIYDVNGGIALVQGAECAALWTFRKLIEHWKVKHDRAVYVPNQMRLAPERAYRYGGDVLTGEATDFNAFLSAVIAGAVYYDPGIKMENASTRRPNVKRRSQFRIKARNLNKLYRNFGQKKL